MILRVPTSATVPPVVLITGGASGLGAALVESFADAGYRVAVLDRADPVVTMPELTARHSCWNDVRYIHGDVTSPASNTGAVERVIAAFGRLDTVIANAAVWDFSRSLESMSMEELDRGFDELFAINVKGYLLTARAALSHLRASRGSLILTLSVAALGPGGGGALYTASKHAGVGVVRQLAKEFAPDVRVNAVAPAGMATSLSGPAALRLDQARITDTWSADAAAARLPLGLVPSADDYTPTYLYLADPLVSGAVTGLVVPVDQGAGVLGRTEPPSTDIAPGPPGHEN
ncbi:SDR family NAD(P)-dependent oxidoreductase [Nocardioides sp. GXZ039]|uniref:SDR family NAD(P)-dependent oxidoreductase n=1 Tax=Nocardioides sp. GXZ039 TaxID=3136018 RepID=UPI0030F3863A